MTVPLVALAVLATFGGVLNLPRLGGWTPPGAHALTQWLDHTLQPVVEAGAAEPAAGAEAEGALNVPVAGLATGLALVALAGAYALYRSKPERAEDMDPLRARIGPVFDLLRAKWYVDEFYHFLFIRPYNWLAAFTADVVDWRFWHDWFHDTLVAGYYNFLSRFTNEALDLGGIDWAANTLGDLARATARGLRRVQSGYVRSYALAVFLGVVAVLGYMLYANLVR
jgi:NADH-quinone oxidoreductase subunit L